MFTRTPLPFQVVALSLAAFVAGCSAAGPNTGSPAGSNPQASPGATVSIAPTPSAAVSAAGPDECSQGIPAGTYAGSLTYATTGPALTHDSTDGEIRIEVSGTGSVTGSWDVAYFVTSEGTQIGTGSVTDGTVEGTARELLLDGTNVVTSNSGSGTSVAWPRTPLIPQEVCNGRVVADWVQTVNGVHQQVGIELMRAP